MRDRFLQGLYRLMNSPFGAVLGGLVYGLWALGVNRHAGWPHAAVIGCAHWAMSVVITMGCVALMRTLFWLPRSPRNGALLAAGGSLLLTYTLLITVHTMIGTPNILVTLAPGMLPTIGFAVVFSSLLLRETADPAWRLSLERRQSNPEPAATRMNLDLVTSPLSGDRHARA